MAGVGVLELLVIAVLALVVLGPSRTVSMARTAGKVLGEVRRAMSDFSRTVEEEQRQLGREITESEGPDHERGHTPEERR